MTHNNNMSQGSDESKTNDTIAIADTLCDQQTSFLNDEEVLKLNHSNMAHFKIIDILGKGGMGAVYKAKDLALERFVAIKMIRISNANQPLMLTEAKTISKLNHPNIVTIYDIARDDDADFIVMEWIDGQPLNTVIPDNGLVVNKVLSYAKQMISAIACAHQQQITHRDIKPANIMVDANDHIKILDFGIAALVSPGAFTADAITTASSVEVSDSSDTTPTAKALTKPDLLMTKRIVVESEAGSNELRNSTSEQSTAVIGTPQYMSPEQILGSEVDVRSDLFSLGVVLYEMLTGVKPFLGINVKQITQAITNGEYIPVADHIAEHKSAGDKKGDDKNKSVAIPTELIAIIDKLLLIDPTQRYQTAQALAQDINVLDKQINRKKNWWQQQHWLTKTLLTMPVVMILAWSIRSVIFPPSTQELVARQLIESKKIAFLPFENISGDPVLQIFSDGIATMLSSDLAEVGYQQGDGTTWVLPASEIRRLEDPSVVGVYNKYGVDVVITGSIQHMGSTRSIHLNLVNGIDGRQLKSVQLSIDAKNLFVAQKQIRQQVMTLLGWRIPAELKQQFAAKKPRFDGAYKHYLQGQGYLYRFDYQDNIEKAIASFQTAIDLDNNYADAYVGLAQAQLRKFVVYKYAKSLGNMESTVQHLISIDSEHRFLNYLYGELMLQKGQYQAAAVLFNKSIKMKPDFIKAYTSLSLAYQRLRKLEEAEKILLTGYKFMPNNNSLLTNLGGFYYKNGDYSKAIEYFELLAKQAPNNFIAYLNVSVCHYLNGNFEKAIIATKQSLAIQANADGYANLGTYYFILRNYDDAVTAFEQMINLNDSDYINWGNLADAYRFANNKKYIESFKQAIRLAEQAVELNPHNRTAIAHLAYYYANMNSIEKSHFYAQQITEQDEGLEQFLIAAAYVNLNMKTAAIKYLRYAINNNYSIAEISSSPLLDDLKNEVKFQKLFNKESK